MSLTHGTKLLIPLILISLSLYSQEYKREEGIIHNEAYALEGRGDTLWVMNRAGLNLTTASSADTINWTGFKGVEVWNMSFGSGHLMMRSMQENSGFYSPFKTDELLLYSEDHDEFSYKYLPDQPPVEDSLVYQLIDSYEHDGVFYCAAGIKGLVSYDIGEDFWDSPGWPEGKIRDDTAASVSYINDRILLSAGSSLYTYTPSEESWDSLDISEAGVIENTNPLSDSVFAVITRPHDKDKYQLNIYDFKEAELMPAILSSDEFIKTAPVSDSSLFVCTEERPYYVFSGNSTWESADFPAEYGLRERMEQGNDIVNYQLNDILYMKTGDVLWICTSKGLIRSRNEVSRITSYLNTDSTDSLKPMEYLYHLKTIKNDLEEVYAYPSIINARNQEAVFAYRLSSPSDVSIDIFDFNMDHVTRIVDSESRSTGGEDGHSTKKSRDRWDGRVSGERVPPGVYYFRIKSENGNRAFGKIIVAK